METNISVLKAQHKQVDEAADCMSEHLTPDVKCEHSDVQ